MKRALKNPNWQSKLTPFDSELFIMVQSLTGRPCNPVYAGSHYYIEVAYANHRDNPDYVSAVLAAIEGRLGNRLISFNDDPERCVYSVRIKFSKSHYPSLIHSVGNFDCVPKEGDIYCPILGDRGCIRALQVKPENTDRLFVFIGNGEMEIDGDKCTYHFRNASGSVYAHAPCGSYIVFVSVGQFKIVQAVEFEREYRRV